MGHKVIVITHAYDCPDVECTDEDGKSIRRNSKRTGVRYLPGGLKVYYCPFLPMVDDVCVPTFTVSFPPMRWIFIREGIEIVHSHQATSAMGNEAITYAAELGLASVYTDHSLFGFNDIASIVLNRVLKVTMSTVGAVICVSNTCRDNFILRAKVAPSIVNVIPNAIDPTKFTPDPSKRSKDRVTVVVVSRLVYRKGVDLLVGIIPAICKQFAKVDFLIGGDGSRKSSLEKMVQREQLQDRVEFLGYVPHRSVRDVLVRGDVFLNCSLTESFCIAILEAASAGLFVVATNVGGVPEVLPPDMAHLADPDVDSLVEGLTHAISERIENVDPFDFHQRVRGMYSWKRTAHETTRVYDEVLQRPRLTFLQPQGAESPRALVQKGMQAFKAGDVSSSLAFFDQADAALPDGSLRPYLWQRGITLYYLDQFKEGSDQFRLDVSVNPLDVEEIVWDIACQAREGKYPTKDRMLALPTGRKDRRKIMSTVYALFRDDDGATEFDLREAGHDGNVADEFYSLFYLGLYCEARTEMTKAERYIKAAASSKYAVGPGINDYMTSCAKVHCKLRGWV
ncbi:hypothetical protein ACHAXT_008144 [Thalassiosira profunda]